MTHPKPEDLARAPDFADEVWKFCHMVGASTVGLRLMLEEYRNRSLASDLAETAEGAEEFAQRLRDLFWQYDNNNDLKWDEHILPVVLEYSQAMRNAGLEAAAELVNSNCMGADDEAAALLTGLAEGIRALKAGP